MHNMENKLLMINEITLEYQYLGSIWKEGVQERFWIQNKNADKVLDHRSVIKFPQNDIKLVKGIWMATARSRNVALMQVAIKLQSSFFLQTTDAASSASIQISFGSSPLY